MPFSAFSRSLIALFVVSFVIVWIMHKPFDVHSSKTWVNKFHCILEDIYIDNIIYDYSE